MNKPKMIIFDYGHTLLYEPGVSGDGYYESVILDNDGNRIEITE